MGKLNLFQKIQAVSNDIKSIGKSLMVGKGLNSYKAVSDLDVIKAVKKAEEKHKLLSIPVKQELIKTEILKTVRENGSEAVNYVDMVKMTLKIIDLETPADFIEIESFGRGLDHGDKGFGKASTYARKYALLNAYKIATGEDPDKDKSKEQTVLTVDQERDIVFDYMLKDNSYLQNIYRHFNVGTMDDLSKEQIRTIYNSLKTKGKI